MSIGVKLVPTFPPMVPLIPDMDLIKVILNFECEVNENPLNF